MGPHEIAAAKIIFGAFWIALSIALLTLPFMFFLRTRGPAGIICVFSGWVIAASFWLTAAFQTYVLWGGFWLFVGVFSLLGVIPIAFIATAANGMWDSFAFMAEIFVAGLVLRGVGAWAAASAEQVSRHPET